jgi:subtilisin family serine protease
MSTEISQQLKVKGIAQVMVILKSPAAAAASSAGGASLESTAAEASSLAGLSSCFQSSELTQNHAIFQNQASFSANLESVGGDDVSTVRRIQASSPPSVLHFRNLGIMLGTVTRAGLEELKRDERVEKVTGSPELSLIKPLNLGDVQLTSKYTWGLEMLEVPKLWKEGLTGKGIRVGHLDTGVDGKHPTLKKAIASFVHFDDLGFKVDPNPEPFDSGARGHGTHTAATIAGRPVQGKSVGVAPEAELASALVIEGGNAVARVLAGIDWAISEGVRVLSMSLGFRGYREDFVPVMQILRARNILPVIASGNEGPGTSRSPGNYAECLSVGAINSQQGVWEDSSSERFVRKDDPLVPDIVAPGVEVVSAKPGGGYQAKNGTSMATPHIAGLAALLFEAKKDATPAEVENAIYNSCQLAQIPFERGNRGFPNAVRALNELTGITIGAAKKSSAKKNSSLEGSGAAKKAAKKAVKKAGAKKAVKKAAIAKKSSGKKKPVKKGASKTKKAGKAKAKKNG